ERGLREGRLLALRRVPRAPPPGEGRQARDRALARSPDALLRDPLVGSVKVGLVVARFFRVLFGRTERRLAIVILVTTMVPLAAALYLGTQMFRQASAIWFNPEIGEQL